MGKKMKLPFLATTNTTSSLGAAPKSSIWAWPSCKQPTTLSFRADEDDTLFKTINSGYIDAINEAETEADETPEYCCCFSNSSECSVSPCTCSFDDDDSASAGVDPVETLIRGLRSETSETTYQKRLFFKPGDESRSILQEAKPSTGGDDDELEFPDFKENSVMVSLESQNPYFDFSKSMEEMVDANGLTDWEGLENLLFWYLRANGKINHGYIVSAFVDLLLRLAINSETTSSSSSSSPLNSYTTTSSSSSHKYYSSLQA